MLIGVVEIRVWLTRQRFSFSRPRGFLALFAERGIFRGEQSRGMRR